MDNIYLQHHGVLGQKWGVRRYQNKDGSLTAEGRKRKVSEKEKNKSDSYISSSKRFYGKESQEDQRDADQRVVDYYEKIGLDGFIKENYLEDYHRKDAQAMYEDEISEYKQKVKDAEIYIKNSEILEKRLGSIDTTSIKYKQVKKLTKQYINEFINASIDDKYQK